MNELLSLGFKSKTQWAQVQEVDRRHRTLEIIYVMCALHHQRYNKNKREIYSPPCAPPSTFANGESLHMGVQLSSQDLGWSNADGVRSILL